MIYTQLITIDIHAGIFPPSPRLGHPTRHFNVGKYRRKQREEGEVQSADFFDVR